MTTNLEAFEHNYGFFNLFNGVGTFDIDAILSDWDGPMETLNPGIAIKQHSCCGSAHSAIDAALKIVAKHGLFATEDIAHIETRTHEQRFAHTNRPQPDTGLGAKFSVQFLTAKALTAGRIRLRDFEDDSFMTAPVAALLPKIRSEAHKEVDAYLGSVRVTLTDAEVLEGEASTRFGRGPSNPMSDTELGEKFIDCTAPILNNAEANTAYTSILILRDGDQIDPVMALISGNKGQGTC